MVSASRPRSLPGATGAARRPGPGRWRAGHQQLVIAGVVVAYGGHHGQRDRLLVQRPSGRRAPNPTAAADAGMAGDRLGTLGRTAREQARDRLGQPNLERQVLVGAPLPVAFAAASARVLVGQALRLGLLKGSLLHEDPLALVPLARAAEADHHRR